MNDLKGIIEDCNKSDIVSNKVIKKIIEIIGQEEWQDLHDENSDICTTMGELIITLNGITELKKEDAELKGEAVSVLDNWCRGEDPCPHLKKRDEQLTKAKKIIRYLCEMARELSKPNPQPFSVEYSLKEAEQFLKEVEQ